MYTRRSNVLILTLVFDQTTSNFSNISNNVAFNLEGVNKEDTLSLSRFDSSSLLESDLLLSSPWFWPSEHSQRAPSQNLLLPSSFSISTLKASNFWIKVGAFISLT